MNCFGASASTIAGFLLALIAIIIAVKVSKNKILASISWVCFVVLLIYGIYGALYTSCPELFPLPTPTSNEAVMGLSEDNRVSTNGDWQPLLREEEVIAIDMVLVPTGCPYHSQNSPNEPDECIDEPFWIGRYEITNAQFRGYDDTRGHFTDDNYPRDSVTWQQADGFCRQQGGELPTEAEWVYAARGPDGSHYTWGDSFQRNYLTFRGNNGSDTPNLGSPSIVGIYPDESASWVGAFDMLGNLWEWTAPKIGSVAVLRGGSWDDVSDGGIFDLDSDENNKRLPLNNVSPVNGFRCKWLYESDHRWVVNQ